MTITIKKHQPYKLQIPRYNCDKILKEDVPPPFNLIVQGYRFVLLDGRPQSGKSSLLISMFRDKHLLKKTWNNVLLVCPKESLASIHKKDNPFRDLDDQKYFTDLSDIYAIIEMIKYFAAEGEDSVVIMDDVVAQLKDPMVQRGLTDLIANRRHYRCSIIMLVQIYNRVPLAIRKLINVGCVMFKPSKRELVDICEELIEQKEEVAQEIMKLTFKKPYDTLWIDVPSQKLYANSDEIIISND